MTSYKLERNGTQLVLEEEQDTIRLTIAVLEKGHQSASVILTDEERHDLARFLSLL